MSNSSYIHHYVIGPQNAQKKALAAILDEPIVPRLLRTARANVLPKSKHPEMAVIYSQIAIEVCIEYAISSLLNKKKVSELEGLLLEFSQQLKKQGRFDTTNPTHRNVKNVINALTGQQIQKQSFWEGLKTHVKLRNDIMHRGAICKKKQAKNSVKIAQDLREYVRSVVRLAKSN